MDCPRNTQSQRTELFVSSILSNLRWGFVQGAGGGWGEGLDHEIAPSLVRNQPRNSTKGQVRKGSKYHSQTDEAGACKCGFCLWACKVAKSTSSLIALASAAPGRAERSSPPRPPPPHSCSLPRGRGRWPARAILSLLRCLAFPCLAWMEGHCGAQSNLSPFCPRLCFSSFPHR